MELDKTETVCLAIDGKTMDFLLTAISKDPQAKEFLFTRTQIYARTSPDQKRTVVENIKQIEAKDKKTVAFVGDGSNDCKALNKANVGLALGNNEASVSSSLVTSSEDISKIIDVISLGKFSLNNMFEVFVMNNGLSFVEMTCYFFLISNEYYFMNWKYVIETLVFTQFAFFLTFGKSNESINRFYPTAGILNWQTMLFLIGQLIITSVLVSFSFILYRIQLFYKNYDDIFGEEAFTDLELHFTTDSMLLSFLFTFISVGYVLGLYTGFPYKRSVFLEIFFLVYIVFLVILNFMAIKPELFSSSYGFQEFFIYYSRTPDIEEGFFWKWLGFGILSGFLVYFSGRAIRYYTFSEELEEIKKKMTKKRKEDLKIGKGDSLKSLMEISEENDKTELAIEK
jgi:magnesium-transporting ATPase (P-type)